MKLSIITINRNNAAGLSKTVDSVIGQTYRDVEFIVIDGGSVDGSREVIESHADRIAHWVSEPDQGVYNAMNKGLRAAHGEYVQFLNSGDWLWAPDVLERIFARNEAAEDLLYGDFMQPVPEGGIQWMKQADELTVGLFFHRGLCHQTLFIKRELFETFGGHDESIRIAADWDFLVRVLLAGRSFRHFPFPVVHYAGGGISVSQAEQAAREKSAMMKRLLPAAVHRDYLELQALKSECRRLKKYEDWAGQIRERNALANYAMVTYWFWLKIKRSLLGRKRSPE